VIGAGLKPPQLDISEPKSDGQFAFVFGSLPGNMPGLEIAGTFVEHLVWCLASNVNSANRP
jgi:hypothetical protein